MNILLPIRAPQFAKSRLGKALDDHQREQIYRQMVERTVSVIQAQDSEFNVCLLCPKTEQRAWENLSNITWVDDQHPGYLAQGITEALNQWNAPAIVLMPDLPLLSASDLSALLKQTHDLVWIPDRRGRGTNGMVWSAGALPYLAFGRPDSMRIHLNATQAPRLYRRGLAWDVDTRADLDALPVAL
jgi:2-phospho-L-lactate guanylyltransferase